jgi:hypothetical protein
MRGSRIRTERGLMPKPLFLLMLIATAGGLIFTRTPATQAQGLTSNPVGEPTLTPTTETPESTDEPTPEATTETPPPGEETPSEDGGS